MNRNPKRKRIIVTDEDRVLAAMRDEDIDYSDSPELTDDFFARAIPHHELMRRLQTHRSKSPDSTTEVRIVSNGVKFYLDDDLVQWIRQLGPQRFNAGLRQWKESSPDPDSARRIRSHRKLRDG